MKKILVAIAVIVVILAGIVFLLPLAFSSDSLRSLIARELSSASGAEIALTGPVRFSVFPDFGIVAHDLSYRTGDGSLSAAAGRVVVSVRAASLLSDRIRVTGIELDTPRIVLSDGRGSRPAPAPETAGEGDVFKMAASWMETLGFDRIEIRDGEVLSDHGNGAEPIAGDIDLKLSAPGIDSPASLTFSGTVDGRSVKLEGELGSLRDLLNRQPADFSLAAQMTPPPHPALASIGAKGRIQLADDGSYRIAEGRIESVGQPMQLTASYVPGDRDYVSVQIKAGTLDYADYEPAETPKDAETGETTTAGATGAAPDLSALRNIDVDFDLQADAIKAGDAVASGVVLQAKLFNGELKAGVSSQQIAGGTVDSGISANFNAITPAISGYLRSSGIDIASLMKLAGQQAPLSGSLASDLQYAFYGADDATIRKSLNVKGTVSVSDGALVIPELAQAVGPDADRITALKVTAGITDISAPLTLKGTMIWNGELLSFSTSTGLDGLLSGGPVRLSAELASWIFKAGFSGTVGLDGSTKGKASLDTDSLAKLMRWLGNDPGAPLGRFSFAGSIAASGDRFDLDDARIALDDMTATGTASVSTAGKTTLAATLAVNNLDFAKLIAGEGDGGAKSARPSSSSTPSDTPIDLGALNQFDADIRLKAESIGYGDIKAGPATAALVVKDGAARLSVPDAAFYGGTVMAEIVADGRDIPALNLSAGLTDVEALPFLTDAAGFERLEGTLNARLAVKGAGATTNTLTRSLDGEARIVFANGAIRGINVAKLFNNMKSLMAMGYTEDPEDKTEFTEMSVTYTIEDGVAKTDDLRLLGPLVRMDGEGSIDLAAQTIDMRLNPKVVGSLSGQGSAFDVSGIGMPLLVTGPLSGPSITPDLKNIMANPKQALEMFSSLGGIAGTLTGGTTDGSGLLNGVLGGDNGDKAADVVTGVIEQLGQQNGTEDGTGSNDLVGSLLQGVLKRAGPQEQPAATGGQAASLPGVPQTTEPTTRHDPAEDIAAAGQYAAQVPPLDIVPIPTPNPRGATVAAPAQQPEQPKSLIDQAVEQVLPPRQTEEGTTGGDGTETKSEDLIRNLLKQMGN